MRPVPIVLILVVAAVGVGAAAYLLGNRHHAPNTPQEGLAAQFALLYAEANASGHARQACELATRSAAKELGCGTAHERVRPRCGPGAVTVGRVDATDAEVRVGTCTFQMVWTDAGWKVAQDEAD